jgi:hypothetical protein
VWGVVQLIPVIFGAFSVYGYFWYLGSKQKANKISSKNSHCNKPIQTVITLRNGAACHELMACIQTLK